MAVSSRMNASSPCRNVVPVFAAAAVLLIVITISSAANAAGDDISKSCLCHNPGNVAFAPQLKSGSLPGSVRTSAQPHWQPVASEHDWDWIVIHHSATSTGSVESIHNNHRQRKDAAGNNWLGIGYHFVIGNGSGMADGEIEPTFRWKQQIHGAHSGSAVHNADGVGICLIGDFQQKAPSKKQIESVIRLIRHLAKRHQIARESVIGHRTVRRTLCPGKYFPLQDVIRKSMGEGSRDS